MMEAAWQLATLAGARVAMAPNLVNLTSLIDDAKCFALVRQHRWPEGVAAPDVAARPWCATAATTPSRTGNAIGVNRT